MKKTLIIISALTLLFSFGACQKKEEKQSETTSKVPSGPIIDTTIPAHGEGTGGSAGVPGHGGKKTEFSVVVPEDVKESWTSAVFIVEDRKQGTQDEINVNIGDEFEIADSGLVVKTGPFLPDFKMSAETITSTSNDPGNPAIGVEIYENGVKVFPSTGTWGWLYVNFPTIHSFEHSRFGIVLKEGIRK